MLFPASWSIFGTATKKKGGSGLEYIVTSPSLLLGEYLRLRVHSISSKKGVSSKEERALPHSPPFSPYRESYREINPIFRTLIGQGVIDHPSREYQHSQGVHPLVILHFMCFKGICDPNHTRLLLNIHFLMKAYRLKPQHPSQPMFLQNGICCASVNP